MVTGSAIPGFASAFGLDAGRAANSYSVEELSIQTGGRDSVNALWPGEQPHITFRVTNKTGGRLAGMARFEVIRYGTKGRPGDFWTPDLFKIAECGVVEAKVEIDARGFEDLVVTPPIPETFGGYGVVSEIAAQGRALAATLVRVPAADPGRVQFPSYALDTTWPEFMNDHVLMLFRKLGIKGARMGASYALNTLPDYNQRMAQLAEYLKWAQDNDVTVMLTIDNGSGPMPLGRPRPWLSPEGHLLDTKDDRAWLPEYDGNFEQWVRGLVSRVGWPHGPVNAVELWNEPWEGISISGWGADIPRYREIYERMARAVEAARREAGVQVLIGGACSSTNTRDRLFADGTDRFLKWLDFVSIHYQPMSADPALVPEWVHRRSPYGPVRVWDTESWIANSDDRVAAVIASMRSQGQDRTAGVYEGNVYQSANRRAGGKVWPVVQTWVPAAAIAATQKFIGQRRFRELLFRNGLPWVFVFDGLASAEDGTVVVLGDLGGIYDRTRTLFRSVRIAADARLTIPKPGPFALFDFYGNPVAHTAGRIVVPLNGAGWFLRADGTPGSFAKLLRGLRSAEIKGVDPVEIVAHDFTSRVERQAGLRVTITNVLNRPVAGTLSAAVSGMRVSPVSRQLELQANETKEVEFSVSGTGVASNTYPATIDFQAGADGSATHREDLHVNVIARRSVQIDGDLSDWHDSLAQPVGGSGIGPSLTEQAWLPFQQFGRGVKNGFATAYLAWDDRYFYFAAKIADDTPDPGMVRFESRDDDSYYYPDKVWDGGRELIWPAGVRRFSYRKNFDIPSGNDHDNVQIAFNVLPEDKKPLLPFPRGTMRHFMVYADTDYEFALNPVAPEYGGGTEIWRLLAPGMPRKHFYPRQPQAPCDGGPVRNGRLAMRRDGDLRIVEAGIPWQEIPLVKERLDEGKTIRFTYRVNDNKGPALELAAGRSVSKENSLTFHDDWSTHWANELEFASEH